MDSTAVGTGHASGGAEAAEECPTAAGEMCRRSSSSAGQHGDRRAMGLWSKRVPDPRSGLLGLFRGGACASERASAQRRGSAAAMAIWWRRWVRGGGWLVGPRVRLAAVKGSALSGPGIKSPFDPDPTVRIASRAGSRTRDGRSHRENDNLGPPGGEGVSCPARSTMTRYL